MVGAVEHDLVVVFSLGQVGVHRLLLLVVLPLHLQEISYLLISGLYSDYFTWVLFYLLNLDVKSRIVVNNKTPHTV